MWQGLKFVDVYLDINCKCWQECSCENPPPDNWDGKNGVFHVSNECPIHNLYSDPNPQCPFHGYDFAF